MMNELKSLLKFDQIEGGDLSFSSTRNELESVLLNLIDKVQEYKTLDTYKKESTPDGSVEFFMVSGEPIEVQYNYMLQGAYLEGLHKVAVGIRVGMGVGVAEELIKLCEELLGKYDFINSGTIYLHKVFRGTNYTTIALATKI